MNIMLSAIKKIFFVLIALFFIAILFILFHEEISEFKYFFGYSLSSQYKKDHDLILPYFDEKFYLEHYGEAVKKSGLAPIDHFLKRGWYSGNWRNHTDPNSWFNTTLYQDRLWGKLQKSSAKFDRIKDVFRIRTNPLVDFLNQPKLKDHHESVVEVWTRKDELGRAWLAVEGLMRLDRFDVVLHIPNHLSPEALVRFMPQAKRGLKLLSDNNKNKSFYHSDFIRNPDRYMLSDLSSKNLSDYGDAITYIKQDFSHMMHRLVVYTGWIKVGKINPTMINIAQYYDEPLALAPFMGDYHQRLAIILKVITSGKLSSGTVEFRIQNFKDYLVRIADGFDLWILGAKLPIKNLRIIPGCMSAWINEQELSKNKEFSVSFLRTAQNRKSDKWNYKLRPEIWEREKEFKVPTKFYLSVRDKDKFPKDVQNRVMPSSSKKFVFNSQFNIATENIAQKDYFTEKLLGCFIALTVPIYMGCPNISDYFDTRGMIIVQSVDELIAAANSLTPSTYAGMLPYLKENRKRALKLFDLEKKILSEFGKRLYQDKY
ncbi:MAG: hypothetical protein KKE11_05575 [Gammaproteobacteria bacterium]|nr:hypothetical protein [Gammaproteobacteria bacterium]